MSRAQDNVLQFECCTITVDKEVGYAREKNKIQSLLHIQWCEGALRPQGFLSIHTMFHMPVTITWKCQQWEGQRYPLSPCYAWHVTHHSWGTTKQRRDFRSPQHNCHEYPHQTLFWNVLWAPTCSYQLQHELHLTNLHRMNWIGYSVFTRNGHWIVLGPVWRQSRMC